MSTPQERLPGELRERLGVFQQNLQKAIDSAFSEPTIPSAMKYFYEGYKHRKKFPWLVEHQDDPQQGLQNGLEVALSTYFVPRYSGKEHFASVKSKVLRRAQPLDEAKRSSLQIAGRNLLQDRGDYIAIAFAHGINVYGPDVDVLGFSPEQLKPHVEDALILYWDRRKDGTSKEL